MQSLNEPASINEDIMSLIQSVDKYDKDMFLFEEQELAQEKNMMITHMSIKQKDFLQISNDKKRNTNIY